MSSIFGDLDLDDIPEDPDYIDDDTYPAFIKQAQIVEGKDDKTLILAVYSIDNEESEYHGRPVNVWMNIYPNVTQDELADMDPGQRGEILQDLSKTRRTLNQMGLTDAQAAKIDVTNVGEMLIGIRNNIKVKGNTNKTTGKFYANVVDISAVEED